MWCQVLQSLGNTWSPSRTERWVEVVIIINMSSVKFTPGLKYHAYSK